MTDWSLEILKLAAQLVGALGVSWLTVRWALGRYKSEKMWERESAAIADLVGALGEIEGALRFWIRLELHRTQYTEEWLEYRSKRYRSVRERFDAVHAVASLMLPEDLAAQVSAFAALMDEELEDHEYFVGRYEAQIAALVPLRANVVAYGKRRLLRNSDVRKKT